MRAAILIIGSLLWDNGEREAWRRSRLRLGELMHVKASIRYGRRSTSRGNTFTMTLGRDDSSGRGILVPCAANIEDVAGLVAEAEALWKAEKPDASPNSIGAAWGCVGALFRPQRVPPDWATAWANHFRATNASSISPVNVDGFLDIPWPVNAFGGTPADVDIILATATKSETTRPTVAEIADAWVAQTQGHERYFFQNVRRDIRTPDDLRIWERIEEQAPAWLHGGAYDDAIALLQSKPSCLSALHKALTACFRTNRNDNSRDA